MGCTPYCDDIPQENRKEKLPDQDISKSGALNAVDKTEEQNKGTAKRDKVEGEKAAGVYVIFLQL